MTHLNKPTLDFSQLHKRAFGIEDTSLLRKVREIQKTQIDQYFLLENGQYVLFEFLPEVNRLMLTSRPPLVMRIVEDGQVVSSNVYRDSMSSQTAVLISRILEGHSLKFPANNIPDGIKAGADVVTVGDFVFSPEFLDC